MIRYTCSVCGKSFENKYAYWGHKTSHVLKECPKCGRTIRASTMKLHLKYCGKRIVGSRGDVIISDQNGNRVLEHTLVAEEILGRKLLPEEVVHHKDGNHQNNSRLNLEITTQDRHAKNHALAGQCNRKMTEQQVREIRKLLNRGHSASSVARQYGVRSTTIDNIKHNRSWRWLE